MDYRTWGFVYLGLGPSSAWALGRRTWWPTLRAGTGPAPRDRRRPPPRRPRRRPCGAPSLRYPQQPSSHGRSGRGLVHDESMEGAASSELPVVALTATSKHGRGRCPYGQPGRPSAMVDVGPGQASSTRRHGFGDSLFSF